MPKFLAVDYGLERTGLAVTNPEGQIAFPLETLKLQDFGKRAKLLDALAALAMREKAEEIVIGLPLYEDGRENLRCQQVRNITERLKRRLPLPFYFMPEILSSRQAAEDLRHIKNRRRLAQIVDQQAACRILESFLAQPLTARMRA